MCTKHCNIQHWVDTDLLALNRIVTNDNESDVMTKNVSRILLYRYIYYLMGKIIPEYATKYKDLQL